MIHFSVKIATNTLHVLLRIKIYVHMQKEDRNSPGGAQLLYQMDIKWSTVKRYSRQVFKVKISIINFVKKVIFDLKWCYMPLWMKSLFQIIKLPLSLQHLKMKSIIVFNFKQWLSIFNCNLCNWNHCLKDKTMFPKVVPKISQ